MHSITWSQCGRTNLQPDPKLNVLTCFIRKFKVQKQLQILKNSVGWFLLAANIDKITFLIDSEKLSI